ncbi:MAG TPA: aminopeptidase P family protein [Acidimicrobiales bacterium]|nr:aminopeptidase P family protein [Acidimicrobiales bacterium]
MGRPTLAGVLPRMDQAARLGRLRASMVSAPGQGGEETAAPEGLLVTSLTNVRYLTGFTGSAGMLFVLPEEAVLITDGRYDIQAKEQIEAAGVEAKVLVAGAAKQKEAAQKIAARVRTLGLEAAHVSWARQRTFDQDWFPGIELVPTTGLVEELRRIKDPGEVARIAKACQIADLALDRVRPRLAEGPTEAEFGRLLDFEMRELGAAGPSFETIVATGPNAAKPHHRPGGEKITKGSPIVLDFGALVDGYCSDMTRTVWVGGVDDPELRRAVEVVMASQAAGVASVKPGTECSNVDLACREVIAEAGWADAFVHGTGHGVGLDIHEAPSVAASSTDTLEVGHVVTVEPGVYLPGLGGVRIEDTVVVTEGGCTPLTSTPKDLP